MRKRIAFFLPVTLAPVMLALAWAAHTQTLRDQLNDIEVGDHWIYNDFAGALTQARREKKPLFVLFR